MSQNTSDWQDLEAIKLLLGVGEPLRGRLIVFDALEFSFSEFKLNVDPRNQVTWENRERVEIADLEGLCAPHLTD